MILAGISVTSVLLGTLYASITILTLIILYKKLLKRFSKNHVNKADFCELSPLEVNPAHGMVEFYFILKMTKSVKFEILDNDYQTVQVIIDKQFEEGQHIIKFDTNALKNGHYFYQLKTPNQQIIRRIQITNPILTDK